MPVLTILKQRKPECDIDNDSDTLNLASNEQMADLGHAAKYDECTDDPIATSVIFLLPGFLES